MPLVPPTWTQLTALDLHGACSPCTHGRDPGSGRCPSLGLTSTVARRGSHSWGRTWPPPGAATQGSLLPGQVTSFRATSQKHMPESKTPCSQGPGSSGPALSPGGRGQRTPRTAPPPGHPSAGEAQAGSPDSAGRHRPQREKLGPSTDGPHATLLWGLQSSTSGASQPTGPLPLAARGQRAGRGPHGQHRGLGGDGTVRYRRGLPEPPPGPTGPLGWVQRREGPWSLVPARLVLGWGLSVQEESSR